MTERRFDDLARSLAQPIPRRRALRFLGAAAAVAAFPALRPGRARAHPGCPNPQQRHCSDGRFGTHYCCDASQQCCKGACVLTTSQCCTDEQGAGFGCPPREEYRASDRRTYRNKCNAGGTDGVCRQFITCPLGTTCCGVGSDAYECGVCCEPNEECSGKRCIPKCAKGRVRCGSGCCAKGEECVGGRCVKRCPPKRVRCGKVCCDPGQRCADARKGKCTKCRSGESACGDDCCAKDQYCCGNTAGGGTCCPKRGGECCSNTDAKGNVSYLCCTPPTRCAYPLNVAADGTSGGVDHGKKKSCCPPERYIEQYRGCCPSGHVSLGGRLVLPAGGGGGLCCRKDKLCGDPASPTCCGTATATMPDQACCNGACTYLQFDPNNCGQCGNVCPEGTGCERGVCTPPPFRVRI